MNGIAAKIQKLIAKADSTTHPEEAAIFMAKAQTLMEEHGLSLLDLGTLEEDDPVGVSKGEELRNNGNAPWRFQLAAALARYYGCKLVGERRGNFTYWVVFGRESARVTFMLMFPYVDRQVLAQARIETAKGNYPSNKHAHGAVGRAMASRVHKLANEQEERRAAAPASKGLNALVPVDAVEGAFKEYYGNAKFRTTRGKAGFDRNAAAAAGRISLNRQTTASAPSRQIAR